MTGSGSVHRRNLRCAAVVGIAAATTLPLAAPALAWGPGDVTKLISTTATGVPGDAGSGGPSISRDGNLIAFNSEASNLVSDDTNGVSDVFVRDQLTGQTKLVSVAFDDGPANAYSDNAAISADGHFVAFQSSATNLLKNFTPYGPHVYVRNLLTNTTSLVSVWPGGSRLNDAGGPLGISANGRFVVFSVGFSEDSTVYIRDAVNNKTEPVSTDMPKFDSSTIYASWEPSVSGDGRYVAFEGFDQANAKSAVFLRDTVGKKTTMLSVTSSGKPGSAAVAARISGDGRLVSFLTENGLLPADTNHAPNIYIYNRVSGKLSLFPVQVGSPAPLSYDGHFMVFSTKAALVSGDRNGTYDVYVQDRWTGTEYRASLGTTSQQLYLGSFAGAISQDGRHVAFATPSAKATPGDSNGADDVFVRNTGS